MPGSSRLKERKTTSCCYNRYLTEDLTKEQAIEEMGYWAALEPRRHGDDGTEGTTEQVYRRMLEQDWNEKHKK
jgi:hypothetical protein